MPLKHKYDLNFSFVFLFVCLIPDFVLFACIVFVCIG